MASVASAQKSDQFQPQNTSETPPFSEDSGFENKSFGNSSREKRDSIDEDRFENDGFDCKFENEPWSYTLSDDESGPDSDFENYGFPEYVEEDEVEEEEE